MTIVTATVPQRLRRLASRLGGSVRISLTILRQTVTGSPRCKICGGPTRHDVAYGRLFHRCGDCGFIFSNEYDLTLKQGMGMEGSWSGPGGGGYREQYLCERLHSDLGKKSFLLYGTGNTPTFETLRNQGFDVVGCDISHEVVSYKTQRFGDDCFFTPETLPAGLMFDVIVAVEVFEHFTEPKQALASLVHHLSSDGIICGTTNFHPGGRIEDSNNPGYMSLKGHVAYWSSSSMSRAAAPLGLQLTAFEMIRPGSVLPDEKFGQLWPNKRVFFLSRGHSHADYFEKLLASEPILPIDRP
jgi:SAM-dependent methyltransferase